MDELEKLDGLIAIPVNAIDADNGLYYSNVWFHLLAGEIHGYGLSPDKTTPFHLFTYTATHINQQVRPDMKYSYTVTYDNPEFGESTLVVQPAGGCGCTDPRKTVTELEKMDALVERGAARLALATSNGSILETQEQADARRAEAERQSAIVRGDRAAAIQKALDEQEERNAAAAAARPWQNQ